MPNEYPLALRQADEARADFAIIEQHLEHLADRITRLPSRAYFCRVLLLSSAPTWLLLAAVLLLPAKGSMALALPRHTRPSSR